MINLFRNRLERMLTKKAVILVAVVIIPLMIGISIYFSGQTLLKDTIAFVTDDPQNIPSDSRINIVQVDETPPLSSLVLGHYNYLVEKKGNNYEVITLKTESDKKNIEQFVNTGRLPKSYQGEDQVHAKRGPGTNILGFISMLILMQGVALTTLYPEDRMLKTFRRILTSPVNVKKYMFVQSIFTFICLYIPSYLAIVLTSLVTGVDIGYSFGMLAILLGILTLLATGFSIFMASIMEQNISLVTSGISIVTCLLGGCFIAFTSNNTIFDTFCNILPQKAFITLIHGVEIGQSIFEFKGQLIYLFIWTVILWLIGVLVTNSKVHKGAY
ncbi:ABC transporter permease [Bacillus mobilis]|uniref:ABC transporter permease n=1 Tax=Bacillus cereus group TaxID=86661 RepID=UPI000A017A12|nr:ABC transporter permease [Bacillus mobilis]MDG1621973.1 ABC transporter permease [Bacillus mobilis]MED4384534.1 ABC transporter permease [Bacillus mobilis]HDR7241580.1 ABC transporter permease [Bacillus mobilis]HDX9641187.1 ABC transporter permease [Bacillus mobilis]